MKIFVDTNIFLDMLFKREGAKEASMVFKAVKNRVFEGVVADITIVNIDYIARKFEADIRTYLKAIEKNFIIVGANNNLIKQSLLIDNLDLEDNIQYTLALDSTCNCIITNDKSFYKNEIETLNSLDFINRYLI
jgi:predicted nucleic acid-binding protein